MLSRGALRGTTDPGSPATGRGRRRDDVDGGSSEQADADEERLLEDEDEDGGHDVARVALGRVEERADEEGHRVAQGAGRRLGAAAGLEPPDVDPGRERPHRLEEAGRHLAVDEEGAGVGEDADPRPEPELHVALEAGGHDEDAADPPGEHQPLGLGQAHRPLRHLQERVGVRHAHELARERRAVLVHHRDRHLAQDLGQVGDRIEEGVEEDRAHEDEKGARVAEDPLGLGPGVSKDRLHGFPQKRGSPRTRRSRGHARSGATTTKASRARSEGAETEGGAPFIDWSTSSFR